MFGVGLAVITAPVWLPVYLVVYGVGTATTIVVATAIVLVVS